MWNNHLWAGAASRRAQHVQPPANGFSLYFWVFREHFWELMRLNLFVLLTSLPILTAAPSIAAMNRVIFNMIEDRPQLLWREYWSVFRRECRAAILAGLPLAAAIALLILLGGFFRPSAVSGWLSLAALVGLVIVFVIGSHVFAMLPYIEISPLQCYKNSAIMLLLCFWHNVATVLIVLALAAVFVLGHPLTTPVLLFFAVPIWGYFIAFREYRVIKKYIAR